MGGGGGGGGGSESFSKIGQVRGVGDKFPDLVPGNNLQGSHTLDLQLKLLRALPSLLESK